ncbi:MAG: cysteine desulfurase, partial [Candidatus Paceibacteria bacterium]
MFFNKKKEKKEQYYFDYAAATPIDNEVLSLLSSCLGDSFANPGALHKAGIASKKVLDDSRSSIAGLISAHSDEIVFTSGGTESDVMALRGVIEKVSLDKNFKGKPHIIVSAIEHSAIFDTAQQLNNSGSIELSILSVDSNGQVLIDDLKNLVKETTVFISVMYVNNEIGVIQDIPAIAKEVRRLKKKTHGDRLSTYPVFHTDASQAIGSLPSGVLSLGIDLMSFNSVKIYGPKGIGVLFVKRGTPISSIFYSGAQEGGLRPGTEPVALIAGFAKALE